MFAGYTATLTIIPPFAIDLGGDPSYHLPLIVGAFGFVGLLIRPFGGQWIYTLGPKRVAVAGTIIVALGSLSYIFALSPWWLMPMRMLQGVGLALGPVATSTIVANLAPPTRRAEAMGYMGNAINISFLYAPFMASFLYEHAGSHNAFLFSALAASVATDCLLENIGEPYRVPTACAIRECKRRAKKAAARGALGDIPDAGIPDVHVHDRANQHISATAGAREEPGQSGAVLHGLLHSVHVRYGGSGSDCRQDGSRHGHRAGVYLCCDGDVRAERLVLPGDVSERGVLRRAWVWAVAAGHTVLHRGQGVDAGARRGDGDLAAGVGCGRLVRGVRDWACAGGDRDVEYIRADGHRGADRGAGIRHREREVEDEDSGAGCRWGLSYVGLSDGWVMRRSRTVKVSAEATMASANIRMKAAS